MELQEARKQLMKLQEDVYLRHPGVDFTHFLMVKRSRRSHSGLPHNWQGNSSVPLQGYINSIVSMPIRRSSGERGRTIAASNYFLGDVDLDFDAEKIAYSGGLDSEKRWCVVETPLDKPLTKTLKSPAGLDDIDCYDPCYLPDGRMLFVSTSGFHGVPCVTGHDYVGNTHLLEKDGTVKRLVFDQDNSWCPVVMNNGRVLYLRWEYTDSAHYFSRVMMTMNIDGSDQKAFYGSNSYWPNSLFYARPLPGSVTKFCGIVSGHHGVAREGELVIFDPSKGRQETQGVVQRIPGRNNPPKNVTVDQLVDNSWPKFLFPCPLDDDHYLVSCRMTPEEPWSIYLVDTFDNMLRLRAEDGAQLLEPFALVEREEPTVIPDRTVEGEKTANIFITDVYFGQGLPNVPKGTVKKLRVFAVSYGYRGVGGHDAFGLESCWDGRRILGEVPVFEDGSASFKIPANTPVVLQPLDENGAAVQTMRSWLVGMPGENESCIGCHETQNDVSPTATTIARNQPPVDLTPFYGPERPFSFEGEIQPVLDKYCVGCHNGEKPDLIWWSVFQGEQMKFIKACRSIIERPRRRLHGYEIYQRADKLKIITMHAKRCITKITIPVKILFQNR